MPSTRKPEYQQLLTRLKAARKDAGLTQAVVAARLGRPQSFVAKSESGERRVDAVELSAFAKLYGKSVEFFVAWDDRGSL